MSNANKCIGCDLYEDGRCTKWRDAQTPNVSTMEWFIEYEEEKQFIPVERMCRNGSIFGNEYIGLTQGDIDRLKNGEIIHVPGEYGKFIGFINED